MRVSEKVMKNISCRELMGGIKMLNSWFVVCLQLQSTVVFLPRLCAGYTGMEEF